MQSTIADPRQPCFKRAQKTVAHRRRQHHALLGGQQQQQEAEADGSSAPSAPALLRRYDTALPAPAPAHPSADAAAVAQAVTGANDTTCDSAPIVPADASAYPAWAKVWFGRWLWDVPDGAPPGAPPERLFSKDVKEVDRWDHTRNNNSNNNDNAAAAAPALAGAAPQAGAPSDDGDDDDDDGQQQPEEQPAPPHEQQSTEGGGCPQLSPGDVSEVLNDCSVVIGLHPDGATDAIVEFALEHDKPFALLPCCVYRKTFTGRRTASGGAKQPMAAFMLFTIPPMLSSRACLGKGLFFVPKKVVAVFSHVLLLSQGWLRTTRICWTTCRHEVRGSDERRWASRGGTLSSIVPRYTHTHRCVPIIKYSLRIATACSRIAPVSASSASFLLHGHIISNSVTYVRWQNHTPIRRDANH